MENIWFLSLLQIDAGILDTSSLGTKTGMTV
jgi:hypothetical protein